MKASVRSLAIGLLVIGLGANAGASWAQAAPPAEVDEEAVAADPSAAAGEPAAEEDSGVTTRKAPTAGGHRLPPLPPAPGGAAPAANPPAPAPVPTLAPAAVVVPPRPIRPAPDAAPTGGGDANPAPLAAPSVTAPSLRVRPADAPSIANDPADAPSTSSQRVPAHRLRTSEGDDGSFEDDAPKPTSAPTPAARLQRTQRQRNLDAGAPADDGATSSNSLATRRTQLVFVDKLPAEGSEIDTPDGRIRVTKKLGQGVFSGAYIIDDVVTDANGQRTRRPAVMKQALSIDQKAVDEVNALRAKSGRTNLTSEQIIEVSTEREVDMQNQAAGNDNPFVDRAQLMAKNRLKMPYAGPMMADIVKELEADTTVPPNVKIAAFELIMRDSLEATKVLGGRGIVHRDLHMGNMTIDGNGRVKIIDFGLAKRAGEDDNLLRLEYGIGAGGQFPFGKNSGVDMKLVKKTDHKTDVFSIGATLQEAAGVSPLGAGLVTKQGGGGNLPTADPRVQRLDTFLYSLTGAHKTRPTASEALEQMPKISSDADIAAARQVLAQRAKAKIDAELGTSTTASASVPQAEKQ